MEADHRQPDGRRPGHRVTIDIEAAGATFQASGKTIEFAGYLRAYVEGADDPESDLADREKMLPTVAVGEALQMPRIGAEEPHHPAAQPLQRGRAHPGVGGDGHRPAEHLRGDHRHDPGPDYVFKPKRGNVLVPTWTAFAVSQLLETHLPELVDYQFTAEMEDELDAISRGEMGHLDYLRTFYFGNDHPGLKQLLADKLTRSTPGTCAASRWASRPAAKASAAAGDFRPRRPLRAVPGAGRPAGEPARGAPAR